MRNLERWADEAVRFFGNRAVDKLIEISQLTFEKLVPLLGRGTDAFYHTKTKWKPGVNVRILNPPWGPLRTVLSTTLGYFYRAEGLWEMEDVQVVGKNGQLFLFEPSPKLLHSSVSFSQPFRSWLGNAIAHRHSRYEHTLDLENAFGQVNGCRIEGLLERYFQGKVNQLFVYLLTIWQRKPDQYYRRPLLERFIPQSFSERVLAQGAHTSSFLFERACLGLDSELKALAGHHGLVITRYVDDITVSSRELIPVTTIGEIRQAIQDNGFIINPEKERSIIQKPGSPLQVMGLCIHPEGRITLGQRHQRQFRTMIHLATQILKSQLGKGQLEKEQYKLVLKAEGMINSTRQIYGSNFPNQLKGETISFYSALDRCRSLRMKE